MTDRDDEIQRALEAGSARAARGGDADAAAAAADDGNVDADEAAYAQTAADGAVGADEAAYAQTAADRDVDADEAAYALVFAALAEDEGFALPADFADAMTARLMPAVVRASPYERYVLPVLLLVACALGVPGVVAALRGALTAVARAPGGSGGLQTLAGVAVVLLLLAAADRLARRAGWVAG